MELTLYPLSPAFLHSAFDYAGNEENTRYILYFPNYSLDETAQFLRAAEQEWHLETLERIKLFDSIGNTHCFYDGCV